MGWDRAFATAATYAKPESFETFRRHIDAAWVEQALAATSLRASPAPVTAPGVVLSRVRSIAGVFGLGAGHAVLFRRRRRDR